MPTSINKPLQYIKQLNNIGIALSAEKNHAKLLEKILISAIDITHADGGTLYLASLDQTLHFKILINKSLKIKSRNSKGDPFIIPPISLYDSEGKPNIKNIAAQCYLQNKTIHIPNAYEYEGFDFSGMKEMDKRLQYHSTSFLVIPLRNYENKIIGILQLINALDETNNIISFSADKISIAESLASQAAITLTQQELLQAQKNLFEALIQLIAKTIDEKSKYTSKHCTRVPILTIMIAEAAQQATTGYFKDFHLSQDEFEELRIAAWLHDCGKIVTPINIVDKSRKLEAITDRIEVIDLRIEVLIRDLKISLLERKITRAFYEKNLHLLHEARTFIKKTNVGTEFLSDSDKEQIKKLAKMTFKLIDKKQALLSDNDVKNLSVSRGTLNDDDRTIINNHASITKNMLSILPYPEYLKNVPHIAGSHHEAMNGKGYPSGLEGEQIPIQARMLAIADIFEALTAGDRPYKSAKTVSESLKIMTDMKNNGHIDPNLFELFLESKIYLIFAKKYLNPEQIDI